MHQSIVTEEDPMVASGYERQFGAYRPHFKGQHKDYYPFEPMDYIGVFIYTIITIGLIVPIFYGCLEAGIQNQEIKAKRNSTQYGAVVFISWLGLMFCFTLGTYFFGRLKRYYTEDIISEKLGQLEKLAKEEKKVHL